MSDASAEELMRDAWTTRRIALDAPPDEQLAGFTRARDQLITAMNLCKQQGEPVPYAQSVHLLANVERDLGNVDQAQSLWEEAVEILRGTDHALELAHKVRHLGDLHRHCGRLGPAESCYDEALALYRKHDSPGSLNFANAIRRMALLKERQGDHAHALELWRETRDLYDAVGLKEGVEEAEQRMARLDSR